MSEIPPTPTRPSAFAAAVESVHRAAARDALAVTEIPAPNGLAPHALALAGDVIGASGRPDPNPGHPQVRLELLKLPGPLPFAASDPPRRKSAAPSSLSSSLG